jgi:hypothetical protein
VGTHNSGGILAFESDNGVEAMRIDSNQNVGIGISSLDSWASGSVALQIGESLALAGESAVSANDALILFNSYWDGTDYRHRSASGNGAELMSFGASGLELHHDTSTTAGAIATFSKYLDCSNSGKLLLGVGASTDGQLSVIQASTAANVPVVTMEQKDVSEQFMKFAGTSGAGTTVNSFIDAADFTTPGTIAGWIKVDIRDDQSTGPITDGNYYIPFYNVPTA